MSIACSRPCWPVRRERNRWACCGGLSRRGRWPRSGGAAERTDPDRLAAEYHALFIGLGRGELVPYSSWYQARFLMERPLATLRADLARLGFARRDGTCEPEDHAAALCEVMRIMLSELDLPFTASKLFFETHVGSWMGNFFADLERAEAARFYRAEGRLAESSSPSSKPITPCPPERTLKDGLLDTL